jgi:hypothetical protein
VRLGHTRSTEAPELLRFVVRVLEAVD